MCPYNGYTELLLMSSLYERLTSAPVFFFIFFLVTHIVVWRYYCITLPEQYCWLELNRLYLTHERRSHECSVWESTLRIWSNTKIWSRFPVHDGVHRINEQWATQLGFVNNNWRFLRIVFSINVLVYYKTVESVSWKIMCGNRIWVYLKKNLYIQLLKLFSLLKNCWLLITKLLVIKLISPVIVGRK